MLSNKLSVRYPWQMEREDFVRRKDTIPIAGYTPMQPSNWSEAELHRVSSINRQAETKPPVVRQHDMGAWMLNDDESLAQLRCVASHDLLLREEPNRTVVAKYADWYRAGSALPPIRVIETLQLQLAVLDGHHRLAAAKQVGLTQIPTWVTLTWVRRDAAGCRRGDNVYLPLLVAKAYKMGWCDAQSVRHAFIPYRDLMRKLLAAPLPFNWYSHSVETDRLKKLMHYGFVTRSCGNHETACITAAGREIARVLNG